MQDMREYKPNVTKLGTMGQERHKTSQNIIMEV